MYDRNALLKKITSIQKNELHRSSTDDKKAIDLIMNELKSKTQLMTKMSGKSKSPIRASNDDET